ncbi:MAG: aldo/keto reductase [Anaerolineaceae bacterium]|nr:aldo/keto reductase [Anaerolineaceae bacterium]
MQYRTLGQTDLEVSVVAMGCWSIVGGFNWGPQDEADSLATIEAALEAGVNFFDTAEGYGDGYSEQLLARVLGSRRADVIIASKVSQNHLAAAEVKEACERSLRNLQTDYIDLYQVHWPSREIPFEETMRALEDLWTEGKIRYIGVSNFGRLDMPDMLAAGRYESNQVPYNLLWRAVEYDIQPQCVRHDISILPYSPLMQGLLTGKFHTADDVPDDRARTRHYSSHRSENTRHGTSGFEAETFAAVNAIRAICEEIEQPMAHVSLAWLLHQPAVTSVLAGARTAQQMLDNAKAGELVLSGDVVARLSMATDELKALLGPDPDMWAPADESRYR